MLETAEKMALRKIKEETNLRNARSQISYSGVKPYGRLYESAGQETYVRSYFTGHT
jgi:ADP-ribose pyrophosphatase YjhB (NUDIX family)